jgi:hypothetical protein
MLAGPSGLQTGITSTFGVRYSIFSCNVTAARHGETKGEAGSQIYRAEAGSNIPRGYPAQETKKSSPHNKGAPADCKNARTPTYGRHPAVSPGRAKKYRPAPAVREKRNFSEKTPYLRESLIPQP